MGKSWGFLHSLFLEWSENSGAVGRGVIKKRDAREESDEGRKNGEMFSPRTRGPADTHGGDEYNRRLFLNLPFVVSIWERFRLGRSRRRIRGIKGRSLNGKRGAGGKRNGSGR